MVSVPRIGTEFRVRLLAMAPLEATERVCDCAGRKEQPKRQHYSVVMEATASPSSKRMMRTPWVERESEGMALSSVRIT